MKALLKILFSFCLLVRVFPAFSTNYFVSSSGNDLSAGNRTAPWRTLEKLNRINLHPGDSIFLEGGHTFTGSILFDSSRSGTALAPVYLGAYGIGKAAIFSGEKEAILLRKADHIIVENLLLNGAGRKEGNSSNGLAILYSRGVAINLVEISGYQQSGLLVYSSGQISVQHVFAHDNGFAGISVDGDYQQRLSSQIKIRDCRAENNPGDPTNLNNHSGNGIIVGNCKQVLVEYCVATNNGWDMPRKGNGPVGIWMYEADSVLFQYNISYGNKTAAGAADGGGFDMDGGVTNSIIQYCLSYNNEGSGYGIFQYEGAGKWTNNIIRNCISENDGKVSAAKAGIFIWNGGENPADFTYCLLQNNIIYNDQVAAISYEPKSLHRDFLFTGNIFVGRDSLVNNWQLAKDGSHFLGNNWWSLSNKFNIAGQRNFRNWAEKNHQEQEGSRLVGSNLDPVFISPGKTTLTDPHLLHEFQAYYSSLVKKGMGFVFPNPDLK